MNKKRVALALAAALGVNTLMVTVGNVGGQLTVAHAQTARLTGDQVKLLDGITIKSLSTAVEISSTGEPELTFTDLKKENIKNVRVTESFKHELFTERKDIDTQVNTGINGTWDPSTGKLKLSSKITQPGIYTGKVEIELTDGTKETYTVSLRKTPSDSVNFSTDVKVGMVEISNLVFNNGAGDVANFKPQKVTVALNNGAEQEVKENAGKYEISALKLTSNGKLKEGDVLKVKVVYGAGSEYTLTEEVAFVGAEKKEVLNAFVSNNADFTKLATTVDADFGVTGATIGTFAAGDNKYDVTADGKTLFTYGQTVFGTNNVAVGAPLTVASKSNSSISLTIGNPTTQSTAAGVAGFVPNAVVEYGAGKATTGIIGDYTITIDGQTTTYFDAVGNRVAAKKINANEAFLEYQQPVGTSNALTASGSITPTVTTHKVDVNFDKLGHGYTPVAIDFGVNATEDLRNISDVNKSIANDTTAGLTTRSEANPIETTPQVTATLVVVTDTLDGAYAQAKFEQTSASEGKITLVGGRKIVGTSTDLNNVRLTVGGATSVSVIGSESTKDDLVFSVQFNGQVPTTIDWTLGVNSTNKVKGTLETGVLESTNIKSVKATNSGTSNIKDQFTVEASFNLSFPNSTTKVTVDDSNSDRVSLDKFKTGEHTVNVTSQSGKYQGTYKAGVMVTQQPFAIEVKDVKSVSNTSASLVIDANFFNTDDIAKVPGGVVQYSEKTVNGSTTTWSDWKDSSTKVEKSEVKEDAIPKTVTGLTGGKTYKFRVVYDYNNGTTTEKVYSKETAEVTLPTSSSSSTITGNGSTSSTTGTSTGSTTINVTTNNSTLSGTSASVKLPSGFKYDSSKTPVATTFKYKDSNGKVVTETKEQFSNVEVKFNGDNVEVYGLVPGKNYDEITVDYTDNNGRTRSIVLRNIQTTATAEVDKYLANVYTVVFSRPADEAGYHFHLNNLKNKKVSLREFLLNMIKEKEFVEKYKTPEEKIEALYSVIVNRTSDEAGKKFWVDEYKKVLAVYGSESTALQAIADRMVNETELKELADKMGVQW